MLYAYFAFVLGVMIGFAIGDLLANKDPTYVYNVWKNRCAHTQSEAAQATQKLFADGAVTIAKVGTDVHLLCESHVDASVVFDWVEEQILATTAKKEE